jgi:hypothetical protein
MIRLPTLQNNGIKDLFGFFIQKALVGLKWWEFIETVVDLSHLARNSLTCLSLKCRNTWLHI